MARGEHHGLSKVSPGPAMPDPSMPCRASGLQPSFTPLDTPRRKPLVDRDACFPIHDVILHSKVAKANPSLQEEFKKIKKFKDIGPSVATIREFLEDQLPVGCRLIFGTSDALSLLN
jgi:hypothetical protein